jgi:hypothetical protein
MRFNEPKHLPISKLHVRQEGYLVTIIHYYLLQKSFIPLHTIFKIVWRINMLPKT